ncbi:MAG: nitroreductase family protein [Spirochaetaceae bacterium]|jgi:nitroreductase|nr:nitroreductase family protein [Spirochaetaceae bacterium]
MRDHSLLQSLFDRKSVRAFTDRPVPDEIRHLIIDAGIQAPSAGNQQLYTILDIDDQAIKDRLAELCDHQPFVARAPFVLVFLADTRRWLDAYRAAGLAVRDPGPGDLLLACADALIAAQNMVAAASLLGLGSCYIGDVLENREEMTELLGLDPLVLPVTLLVFGYPAPEQAARAKPPRPRREYLVQKNRYTPRTGAELRALHGELNPGEDYDSWMAAFCERKYMSGFAREMNRSAGEYLKAFYSAPGP